MTFAHTTTIFFRGNAIKDSDNGQSMETSGSNDGAAGNGGSLEESSDSSKAQPGGTAKGSILPPPGPPEVVVSDFDAEETPSKHRSFATWLPKRVQPLPSPSGSSRVQQVRTNVPAIVPALPITGPSNAVTVEDPGRDRTSDVEITDSTDILHMTVEFELSINNNSK